eukprot:TRINITY_DN5453_c0_g3_i1.p1 TRINITY_DN5453_c0_g3~~TRINITY_DN5453_c0_g3_i1.p1  ORF type:complete len:337 (-),score=51.89 TRINITY_DN5453_c0_g3_i1:383-1393(-)
MSSWARSSVASERSTTPKEESWLRKWVGVVSMALLIVTWVAQSEIAQAVQNDQFQKPMFIVWYNHSSMALMLPAQLLWCWSHGQTLSGVLESNGLSLIGVLQCSILLCAVYTTGDYVWYVALNHTSVSAATCVFNTSCIFTYCFSMLFLKERFDYLKIIGMAFAVPGAIITALYPGDNNQDSGEDHQFSWLVLVLAGAAGYGLYEVLFAKYTRGVDHVPCVNLVTGLLGVVNIVVFWVLLLPLDFLSSCPQGNDSKLQLCSFSERLGLPPDARSWGLLNANAATAMMFNVFFLLAIAPPSPVLVSVGCMLSIPATALADFVLYQDKRAGRSWEGRC